MRAGASITSGYIEFTGRRDLIFAGNGLAGMSLEVGGWIGLMLIVLMPAGAWILSATVSSMGVDSGL